MDSFCTSHHCLNLQLTKIKGTEQEHYFKSSSLFRSYFHQAENLSCKSAREQKAMAAKSFSSCAGIRSPVLLGLLFFCSIIFSSPYSGVQATTQILQGDTSRMLLASEDSGNMSLPDPDVINAYLRTNTTLRNTLLPGEPPLQLIKCHVYLMQTGILFNFYTADHPGGCEGAPRTAAKPLSSYSANDRFWSFELRESWIFSWPLLLALGFVHCFLLFKIFGGEDERHSAHMTVAEDPASMILSGLAGVLFVFSVCMGFCLALKWTVAGKPYPQLLPDPATNINPVLHSNNITLNLHACSGTSQELGRDVTLFQFYTGMPQSFCSQLLAAKVIYGDYLDDLPKDVRFWYIGGPVIFLFLFPVRWTLLTSAIFCWALLLIDVPCFLALAFGQRSSVSEGEAGRFLGQELDTVEGSLKDHKYSKLGPLDEAV